MKLIHLKTPSGPVWVRRHGDKVEQLPSRVTLTEILVQSDSVDFVKRLSGLPMEWQDDAILPPIEDQDIWACGLTYFNSRRARVRESLGGGDFYDKVYAAPRAQIFPKGRGRDVAGPHMLLGFRDDTRWVVPEPELVLILNASGRIVGATLGNDLSCRDIEGENPLYQPQAKIWHRSSALGPVIDLIESPESLCNRAITMTIHRQGERVFHGETNTSKMVRKFTDLGALLFQYRCFPDGAYLFTGTGIIPPDDFSLLEGDNIQMSLEGVGTLENIIRKDP